MNQLTAYERVRLLDAPLAEPPRDLPVLPDPADDVQPLDPRARAYLHTNCAQCHRPGGPTPSGMDLRYATPAQGTHVCNVLPESGDLGIADARIVAPGDPDRSLLLQRMRRRDAYAMPPLGTNIVDADGSALIEAWIAAMTSCA